MGLSCTINFCTLVDNALVNLVDNALVNSHFRLLVLKLIIKTTIQNNFIISLYLSKI